MGYNFTLRREVRENVWITPAADAHYFNSNKNVLSVNGSNADPEKNIHLFTLQELAQEIFKSMNERTPSKMVSETKTG